MKIFFLLTGFLLLRTAAFSVDASAAAPLPSSDYHISSGDMIEFKIYNQADMTTLQRVTATGEIRLPLIGTVNLADFTVRKAESMLEQRYRDEGFFVAPQVILSVQQYGDR